MGRRKKGLPISGWILVDKPAGVGSTAVVNKLKFMTKAQKAGHGGTLDPDATGLLPVAFGEATKLLPFLEDRAKTYKFEVKWGAETSTDDASGEVIEVNGLRPTVVEIEAVLPQFIGDIMQTPPQVSAVKVDGQRAYDLVREGVQVNIQARPLTMHDLQLVSAHDGGAVFEMSCGKGGYVRAIARDMGRALGCLGHVKWLRRTATLGFDVADAITFDDAAADPIPAMVPIDQTPDFPLYHVNALEAEYLRVGRDLPPVSVPNFATSPKFAIALFDSKPISLIEFCDDGIYVRRGLEDVNLGV